jgi:BirA family biotin operon repressor/biotin-[acetyl-CoA-carboxylase] ligase
MQRNPAATVAGTRLLSYDTLDSTNAEAIRLARAGERGPLWIVARSQSAGRGRQGRCWVSNPGNLYTSLLLTDPSTPDRAAEISFVAALALHDAIVGSIPGLAARLQLKWPNDLLIDSNKVAGILIEGEGAAVAVGMGVNCIHHPAATHHPATDLAAAGVRATTETLLESLSKSMMIRLSQWNRGAGFAEVRANWLDRAAGLGKPIRVTLAEGELAGQFETIDQTGRLVLRRADGTMQPITAGDVFLTTR